MLLLRLPEFRLQPRGFMGWWLRCTLCSRSLSQSQPTTPKWSPRELSRSMGLTSLPSKRPAPSKMSTYFGLQLEMTALRLRRWASPNSRFLAALRRKLLQMHGQ
eukprot:10564208-Karenia_brevis.AAC.1